MGHLSLLHFHMSESLLNKIYGDVIHETTSCKSTWDNVWYFGTKGLSMILCLWSPLHPLSKLVAVQDHAQNLEEQLWMGGRSVLYLTDLGCFFRGSVSTVLLLVVASRAVTNDAKFLSKLPKRVTTWSSLEIGAPIAASLSVRCFICFKCCSIPLIWAHNLTKFTSLKSRNVLLTHRL